MKWLKYGGIAVVVLLIVLVLGLKPLLSTLGLHRHYEIPSFNATGKRALIVTTSHGVLGKTGRATGVFSSEMTIPYYAFLDARLRVDIASIKGGKIPVEPASLRWPLATDADRRFMKDAVAQSKLQHSIPIAKVNPSQYDVIFLAGGWGAAYDFAQSNQLAKVITTAHAKGVILGSVCHGALGLVNAKAKNGVPLLKGRKATGVTNLQVKQLGISMTPKHPETELRKVGALFESKTAFWDAFATHVVVDGKIVTGQNQNSGGETSHRILELLTKK